MYGTGLNSNSKYGNVGFVKKVVSKRGALGKLFLARSANINVNRFGIKMGDTPSVFFVMNGNWDNPRKPSWGGQYCRDPKNRNRFFDCKNPKLKLGNWDGALSIAKHRIDFLKDWEQRLKWIYD